MRSFDYPCPACRTTSNLHEGDCQYSDEERDRIEAAYTEILANLSKTKEPTKKTNLIQGSTFTALYEDCLQLLQLRRRVVEEDGMYRLLDEEERKDAASEPPMDPIKTIYDRGSVDGAHDNSVFAMVAYYEMIGLSWEETKERTIEWLNESGSWERGGFAEKSPEEVLAKKRHVYEEGYGWMEKATAAKRVIDERLG